MRVGADWVAAVVNHGSYEELSPCLRAVQGQTLPPVATYVYDTGQDPACFAALKRREVGVGWELGPNLGYAGGANHLLKRIASERPHAKYALLLNPDTVIDESFAAELVRAMDADPSVALASGKLLRPGRSRIDSAGIVLPRHRRPRDRGSGEQDCGQYDQLEYVFGVSGAALMLRRTALASLAIEGEIFDEDFFVYHEDTDLSWRANRLGWRVLYEPRAIGVHGRRWRADRRFEIPVDVRRHSFKNHYLQLIKNERLGDVFWHLPWILGWEMARLAFALFRDPRILSGYVASLRLAPNAWRKRRRLMRASRVASAIRR